MSAKIAPSAVDAEVADFLRTVQRTGRPEEWRLLKRGKPPNDRDFHVWRYVIPAEFRDEEHKAHCAFCSPNGHKYWVGYLVRFAESGEYFVVGHTCGVKRLGVSFVDQVEIIQKDLADEAAEEFLIDNLSQVSALRELAFSTLPRAREIDELRVALFRGLGPAYVRRLLREAADGTLAITEVRDVPYRLADGRVGSRRTPIVLERIAIQGLAFLRRRLTAEALASNASRELAALPAVGDTDALDKIIEWRRQVGQCAVYAQRLRDATINLAESLGAIKEASDFLSTANFGRIRRWADSNPWSVKLRVGTDAAGRLVMAMEGQSRLFRCEKRACLTSPIPEVPPLVEGGRNA